MRRPSRPTRVGTGERPWLPDGRAVEALHRVAWCLLALGISACAEEPPVKQAEPKVEVTTQALLTCGQVAAVSCTGTTTPLQCSAVTAVSGDYLIAHITTTNNGAASSFSTPSGWTQLGTTQINSSTSPYLRTGVFYKAWAAAGDAQPSFTWSGTRAMLGVVSWRGCGAPSGFVANTTTTTTSVTVATRGGAQSFFSGFSSIATTNSANWTDLYNIVSTGGISVGGARNTTAGATTNTKANARFAMAVVLGPGSAGTGSIGATCTAGTDCASGNCVDGYCCSAACNGGLCDTCSAAQGASSNGACTVLGAGNAGVSPGCSPYACNGSSGACPTSCPSNDAAGDAACAAAYYCNGSTCVSDLATSTACVRGSQCTSGNCADGYCCNAACSGGLCDACSVALGSSANGTCTTFSAGSAGIAPTCSPYVCSGSSGSCPTSCPSNDATGDASCTASSYCNGSTCVADASNSTACVRGSQCTSGNCVDGYCCNTACNGGSCDVCAASLGASANGTCSIAPLAANYVGSPSCSPYYCDGATSCPTTCSTSSECVSGYYCNGTNCLLGNLAQGASCSVDGQCLSGFCRDGVCCGDTCGGGVTTDCQACSVAGGASTNGTCGAVLGSANVTCRSAASACDSAELCPNQSFSRNVDSNTWSDYASAPIWNCTAAGTTDVNSTTGQVRSTSCTLQSGYSLNTWVTLATSANNVAQQGGGPNVMVVRLRGLTVSGGHVVNLQGDKPIIFLVDGNVLADGGGRISADASFTTAGPGGSIAAYCGTGGNGSSSTRGGGGGGFGQAGSQGGLTGGAGGAASGDLDLVPLRGGCSGGTGGSADAGGAGGGAVQISASGSITVGTGSNAAHISAAGGGGQGGVGGNGEGGGGGGSGGAVLLEATSAPIIGSMAGVRAHAGSGGEGAGDPLLGSDTGANGNNGSSTTDTAATGGTGASAGGNGGSGGTCAGHDCATAGAGPGAAGGGDGGGGGGGGRGVVQLVTSTFSLSCPADIVAAAGTLCRGTMGVCDSQETCTGTSGACPSDALLASGTSCRGTAGECDLVESCTGTSVACPSDSKKSSGTACTSDGNACTLDQCDGSAVACQHPAGNAGASCRGTAGECDVAETCTGTSTACPTDVFLSSATSCRGTAGECDLTETCTGSTATCPADSKKTSGTACTADANPCSLDQCDGSAVTCMHPAGNAGTVCNATTGFCDLAETCTGTSTTCPANAYKASSVVCRATAGVCDAIEYCTGVSDSCPATDAKQAFGTACTADADPCTVDRCDGTTNVCQHPAGNAGTSCRATAGACDVAEVCTGTTTGCPADLLAASSVVCRATAGVCDFQETCTGTSNACPTDVVRPNTYECRALSGAGCDVAAENCNGTSGACPSDTYQSSAVTCRATTGVCDLVEMCTGSSNACPANAYATTATVCRATTGVCDAAETCTGTAVTCPADVLASSSTPCRYQSNVCDAVDFCTGASGVCPADAAAPVGTDCGYTTGAVTIYSTGAPANSALLNAGYSAASVTNAGPNSTWTDAIRYATTLPTTGANQYLYQQISTTARKFQAYDMVEYDVYLADPQSQLGGLDIENGGTALRGAGISDQNSLSSHPATNIVSNAYGAWYHRRYALGGSNMVNTTSTSWTIVDENDAAHGAYTAYYDNIIVAATAGECNGANVCKIKTAYGCTANSDCATNVCNATTLDASNTHRWPLDTNANATIGGQNGTTNGTVTWSGGAAVLTGTTTGPYISVPTAVMSGLTDVTFEAWFSIDTQVTWQRIFDFGNDTTEYIFLAGRFDTTNIPRVAYKRDGGAEVYFNATSAFTTGTLTHVALSVDGATSMTLYINGTASGSVALGASDTLAAITFDQNYLGGSQWADPRLDGNIYDFRVYNKALSAAEVLATYRKGVDSKICFAQYPNGISCTSGGECLSGFCVDDRCCSTACDGGDTTNCQGCSIAVGAAANGTCGVLANGTVCRASADVTCDLAETCNGVATTCPADTQ